MELTKKLTKPTQQFILSLIIFNSPYVGVDFAWRRYVIAVLTLSGVQDELHECAEGRTVVEIYHCLVDAATVSVFDAYNFAVVCRY